MENQVKFNSAQIHTNYFSIQHPTNSYTRFKRMAKKITLPDTTFNVDSNYWIKGSIFNIGFNRVGLYNWAGGGQNSMSIQGLTNNYLLLKHRKISWMNQLTLSYGIIKMDLEIVFLG